VCCSPVPARTQSRQDLPRFAVRRNVRRDIPRPPRCRRSRVALPAGAPCARDRVIRDAHCMHFYSFRKHRIRRVSPRERLWKITAAQRDIKQFLATVRFRYADRPESLESAHVLVVPSARANVPRAVLRCQPRTSASVIARARITNGSTPALQRLPTAACPISIGTAAGDASPSAFETYVHDWECKVVPSFKRVRSRAARALRETACNSHILLASSITRGDPFSRTLLLDEIY
jgi:hypothetical protein